MSEAANHKSKWFLEVLQDCDILKGLSEQEILQFAHKGKIQTYQNNEIIFEQNSQDDDLYILLQGNVKLLLAPEALSVVEKGSIETHVIESINPGSAFGEMALFDKQPRSATAIAKEDETKLLVIKSEIFDNFFHGQKNHLAEQNVLATIVKNTISDLSIKLRRSNKKIINEIVSTYFVTFLVASLTSSEYQCSPIDPVKRTIYIRRHEYFVLSHYVNREQNSANEIIDIYFFADPEILRNLLNSSYPSGSIIFNALFSLIRWGKISRRIDSSPFTFEFTPDFERRAGKLHVHKSDQQGEMQYTIEWQIKGIISAHKATDIYANLFLHIYIDNDFSTAAVATKVIKNFAMPIQNGIFDLIKPSKSNSKYRLLIIHHRTHEVVAIVTKIKQLGYSIDSVIGIPYGEADWGTNILLDQASNHTYLSLKTIKNFSKNSQYVFDFKVSSQQRREAEIDLLEMFSEDSCREDYLAAMTALARYRLRGAIEQCKIHSQKLMIYEDGAYFADIIYRAYYDKDDTLHPLIKTAVDAGVIVGIIEGTMSGERKHLKYLKEKQIPAILPVLSTARSLIKIIFESRGIAESIIQAAVTALGRIGLPSFLERRIAIIGGNGTLGLRLVEQLKALHNSTANIVVVDINEKPNFLKLEEDLPYVKKRVEYQDILRYSFDEDSQLIWFSDLEVHKADLKQELLDFLSSNKNKLILYDVPEHYQATLENFLLNNFDQHHFVCEKKFNLVNLCEYAVTKESTVKTICILSADHVLMTNRILPSIIENFDTILGVSGFNVFKAMDLLLFLERKPWFEQADRLVLLSGSSKDYEFKEAIDFLNLILKLQYNELTHQEEIISNLLLFRNEITRLLEETLPEIADIYEYIFSDSDFLKYNDLYLPSLKKHITWDDLTPNKPRIIRQVLKSLSNILSVRKDIRDDVGTIYHIKYKRKDKILYVLADGFVINFFARHEKGAKSEYIDPIVTLQALSLLRLTNDTSVSPGLYDAGKMIDPQYMSYIWRFIDKLCMPWFMDLFDSKHQP